MIKNIGVIVIAGLVGLLVWQIHETDKDIHDSAKRELIRRIAERKQMEKTNREE